MTRFEHALTIDDPRLAEYLHGLIQDIEGGYARRLAFIGPGRIGWPLPIYELALMAARARSDINIELSITIARAQETPLAIFGQVASEAVRQLLERDLDYHLGLLRGPRCGRDRPPAAPHGKRDCRRLTSANASTSA